VSGVACVSFFENFTILQKKINLKNSGLSVKTNSVVLKKTCQKTKKNCHTCLQYERVLKIFLLSYSEFHQTWLNILMDNPPLEQHNTIEKKQGVCHT